MIEPKRPQAGSHVGVVCGQCQRKLNRSAYAGKSRVIVVNLYVD